MKNKLVLNGTAEAMKQTIADATNKGEITTLTINFTRNRGAQLVADAVKKQLPNVTSIKFHAKSNEGANNRFITELQKLRMDVTSEVFKPSTPKKNVGLTTASLVELAKVTPGDTPEERMQRGQMSESTESNTVDEQKPEPQPKDDQPKPTQTVVPANLPTGVKKPMSVYTKTAIGIALLAGAVAVTAAIVYPEETSKFLSDNWEKVTNFAEQVATKVQEVAMFR